MTISIEQAHQLTDAIKRFVERCVSSRIDGVLKITGPLIDRADSHSNKILALENRIAALERKAGGKAGPVYLDRARDR